MDGNTVEETRGDIITISSLVVLKLLFLTRQTNASADIPSKITVTLQMEQIS
jgi:hypothetical protein